MYYLVLVRLLHFRQIWAMVAPTLFLSIVSGLGAASTLRDILCGVGAQLLARVMTLTIKMCMILPKTYAFIMRVLFCYLFCICSQVLIFCAVSSEHQLHTNLMIYFSVSPVGVKT
jgi:hypothetical protein